MILDISIEEGIGLAIDGSLPESVAYDLLP